MPSVTKPQVHAVPGYDGELPIRPPAIDGKERTESWNRKVRRMRRDPTLKLARLLIAAPILASRWSYESTADAPPDAVELVGRNMDPLRLDLMDHTVRGWMDYGWAPFEKVYEYDPPSGEIRLRKLKPLLQDLTTIYVDKATGAYRGLENCRMPLEVMQTLTLSNEVEGTYWYGTPMMDACEAAYDAWQNVAYAADRYDRRIAGSHWVIYYPHETSIYDGVETKNSLIAESLLRKLESAGSVVLPREIDHAMAQAGISPKDAGWSIELISDQGVGTTSFTERMKYLDTQKVRGFGVPERSVLEGQFGTKAEAGEHGDFAITGMEMKHEAAVVLINRHVVDHLLELHYGEGAKGTVYIVPTPIADTKRAFLKEVYRTVMANPDGFLVELASVDLDALKDLLGIPINGDGMDLLDEILERKRNAPDPPDTNSGRDDDDPDDDDEDGKS